MSNSLEIVEDALSTTEVHPRITLALQRQEFQPEDTSLFIYAPDWSTLFNTFSAACTALRIDPDEALAADTVSIPEGTNWLGTQLLKLINNSIDREPDCIHHINTESHVNPELSRDGGSDVCESAEGSFNDYLKALPYGGRSKVIRADIYVDEINQPVLFTKHSQTSEDGRTTLALQDLSIDGLNYPAGVIFQAKRSGSDSIDQPIYKDPFTTILDLDSLQSIMPLRLSTFPIPRIERDEAIRVSPERNAIHRADNNKSVRKQIDNPSIEDIQTIIDQHVEWATSGQTVEPLQTEYEITT